MKLWAGIVLAAAASTAVAQSSPTVSRALADPARADQAGDDARRQAAPVVAFSGAKPGDRVIDFLPGSGYWSRIFSGVVGPRGRVFALWPAAAGGSERAKASQAALAGRKLANVSADIQPTNLPTAPAGGPVDLFWTVQNYHDIPNRGAGEPALRSFNQAVFNVLKPGGTFVVIDHADGAGAGLSHTETTHRIEAAAVRRQVEAAGFRFAGESRVLRNPADDHSANVFDASIRGHTDQFVYKFRKPG